MTLSPAGAQEFKKLYESETGKTITDAEALEMGQRLLNITELLYQDQIDESPKKS